MVPLLIEECRLGYVTPLPPYNDACLPYFFYYIESNMEVFMDDLLVYRGTFDLSLKNLGKVIRKYGEVNLILNWQKHHFVMQEGAVLGHVFLSLLLSRG